MNLPDALTTPSSQNESEYGELNLLATESHGFQLAPDGSGELLSMGRPTRSVC